MTGARGAATLRPGQLRGEAVPFEAPDQDVRIAVLHGDEPEQAVLAHLDAGRVLMLPEVGFEGRGLESLGHWPEGKSKTVSLDPADRTVKGAPADVAHRTVVANAMADYAEWSKALLGRIAPSYGRRAAPGRTSFRARSADRARKLVLPGAARRP